MLLINPYKQFHFGYHLVRHLNIRLGAKNIHVVEERGGENRSYGCKLHRYAAGDREKVIIDLLNSETRPSDCKVIYLDINAS